MTMKNVIPIFIDVRLFSVHSEVCAENDYLQNRAPPLKDQPCPDCLWV